MARSTPPGPRGLPYIGTTLAILRDPYSYGRRYHERYGPIFRTTFLGKPTAILLGADAQRYVLVENPSNFLWQRGYAPLHALFGEALFLTDGAEHDFQRKALLPAFHTTVLADYLTRVHAAITTVLDGWGEQGERPFYHDATTITFTLASSLLVGIDAGDAQSRFARLWNTFSSGMAALTHVDAPFTLFGRSLRASRELDQLLHDYIRERRKKPTDDALGLLIQAHDHAGEQLTDDQLIAQIKILIFAGYTSTATTMTWLISALLRHPETYARLRAEIDAVGIPQRYEDLRAMPYLDATIKETLRLYPQSYVIPRGVRSDFEFGDYRVPAAWNALLIPAYTQRMADYFPEPETFAPARFLPPRNEHTRTPFAWIGFGGGSRICLGERLAQLEIMLFVAHVLKRFDLRLLPGQDFTPRYQGQNRPRGDVNISYQTR